MALSMRLYSYWRSSAAYRVRIGLNLKGLPCEIIPVHLVRNGGEQHASDYVQSMNPQHLVPTLEVDGNALRQSLAILEFLDEIQPAPALLPDDPLGRQRVRALAQLVACDIHPLNNLRVMQYLGADVGADDAVRNRWTLHWMRLGFDAMERWLADDGLSGRFCHGDAPGLADCCLIPQLYNARRFGLDLEPYPTLVQIETHCLQLPAFDAARPERQPDAG